MEQRGYKRYPTIHDDRLVFVSEDDLWEVPASGGKAVRITSNRGLVSFPYFSPDGKYIAFTGQEEGQKDVYVIPSDGGPNVRLTFLGQMNRVIGWTPDSKYVLFISNSGQPFMNKFIIYKVPVAGGLPEKLPYGNSNNITFGPGNKMVIGRHTADPAIWKRYRGGRAGFLWIDNIGKGNFKRFLNLNGNLASPMWVNGRIYFISDHEGMGRLYSAKPGGSDIQCHTDNKVYFNRNATTDGKRIVFHSGGDIYLFNPEDGKAKMVDIEYNSPRVQLQRKFADAGEYLEGYNISPNGNSLVVTTRGKSYTFSNWEGPVLEIGKPHGVRYRLTQWLWDNKSIVTVSDEGGAEGVEIHTVSSKGEKKYRRLKKLDIGRTVNMIASPTEDKVGLANHRQELFLIDLKTGSKKQIAKSDYNRVSDFSFSPDGNWIVYSLFETEFLSSLYLYNVKTGKNHAITHPDFSDFAAVFDPLGRFIYFLSSRDFNPVYDESYFQLGFPLGSRIYLITLKKDMPMPFTPEFRNLYPRDKKNSKVVVDIDLDGIEKRMVAFPLPEARYDEIWSIRDGLLFKKDPIRGSLAADIAGNDTSVDGELNRFNFNDQKIEEITTEVTSFKVSNSGNTLVYRSDDSIYIKSDLMEDKEPEKTSTPKSGWVDLDRIKVSIKPSAEWHQMYAEAWRLQKEQYWVEDMAGMDWELVYKRYLPLVDKVGSRAEMSDLIWEMQGELGTSHAYEGGGDYRPAPNYHLGFLGAEYEYDPKKKAYRIEHIIKGDAWKLEHDSPLNSMGIDVREGDYLTAINGETLDEITSPNALLVNQAGNWVNLSFKSGKTGENKTYAVKTLSSEHKAKYREWVEENREYVHKKSNGKLGYVHIPNMGPWGYSEFHRYYIKEADYNGLIIDVRHNGGGHVSQLILEKLARKHLGYGVSRWGKPDSYPSHSVAGPMVALTDENAGSDGDIFSHNFKQMKLGSLIGKRTWGGVIGIFPRHYLADGTMTTQPEFATWMKDVGWNVENYGTDPDIDVDIKPQDYAKGIDPQLDTAIKTGLTELKKNPVKMPSFKQKPKLSIPFSK